MSYIRTPGDFTRFLKAPASERAQLLEKITDTRKYSDISRAAFERAKHETQQVEHLKAGMAGVTLLATEEVALLEEEVRDILREAAAQDIEAPSSIGLGTRIAQRFAGLGLDAGVPELRGEAARPASFGPP